MKPPAVRYVPTRITVGVGGRYLTDEEISALRKAAKGGISAAKSIWPDPYEHVSRAMRRKLVSVKVNLK